MPPDFVADVQQALARLAAAAAVGAVVSVNRKLLGKPAGMRTHALVALGAAVVTLSAVLLAERDGDRGATR